MEAYERGGFDGVGIALGEVPGEEIRIAGIDLDKLGNDPTTDPRAIDILAAADSYAELSPSGRGLHVLGTVRDAVTIKTEHLEIYSAARYFTFTGNPVNGAGVSDITDAIATARRVFSVPLNGRSSNNMAGANKLVPHGTRHPAAMSEAARMRRRGLRNPELLDELRAYCNRRFEPPHDAKDAADFDQELVDIARHADGLEGDDAVRICGRSGSACSSASSNA